MCKLNITCTVLDGACSCSAQVSSEIGLSKPQNSLLSEILTQIKRNLLETSSDSNTETNEISTEYSVSPDLYEEEADESAVIDLISPPLSSALVGKTFAFIFELRGSSHLLKDPTEVTVTLKNLDSGFEVEWSRHLVNGTCFFRKLVPAEAFGRCLVTVDARKNFVKPLVMKINVKNSKEKTRGKKRRTSEE